MTVTEYHHGAFPPSELDWPKLLPLIGPANAAVARYDGVLRGIPNMRVLLSPLTTQEAVLSSKIEGTQATFGEVLEFEADSGAVHGDKRDDIQEILNYRSALRHAIILMEELPLSQRVVREAHRVLLDGVRGHGKTPGEYRRLPNWIGPAGCTPQEATFVPLSAERVPTAMSLWERYLHSKAPDLLVQLAILHAEFESVHPFLDGNGRVGRLLVPLFLVDKKILMSPNLYISAFFEAHRDEYYGRLLSVSRDGDWVGWCAFFLRAITTQAETSEAKAVAILDLYRSKKDWIIDLTHSQYAVRALDWFFTMPIFTTSHFVTSAEIPKPTASRIVRLVRDHGLLRELRPSRGRRPAILAFSELLNIAEGRDVF